MKLQELKPGMLLFIFAAGLTVSSCKGKKKLMRTPIVQRILIRHHQLPWIHQQLQQLLLQQQQMIL